MGLKSVVKKNMFLSKVAYFVRENRCRHLLKKFSKLPLENKVFFYRSGGGYGDNPKAIAEFLHINHPNIKLVWACSNDSYFDSLPEYIKPVVFESGDCYRELATAGAWVCSTILPNGMTKRKGQLYIQTWHGDKFLKKIAKDSAADISSYKWRKAANSFCESTICDYFVTGCEWFVHVAASALDYKGDFLRCGMPRNDCLVYLDPIKCSDIRHKIGLSDDVKVLIYAPTYRDYEKNSGEIGSDINLVRILDVLEQKYNDNWICLMRAHHGKKVTINNSTISDERFIDVTSYPDMADLLMVSDMLISDYSSCGADFALTGKMVLLYQDDLDKYTSQGRTLYFSREDSPYFTALNMEEAIDIIEHVTKEDYIKNCKCILDFYDSFESGHACEDICNVILDSLSKITIN